MNSTQKFEWGQEVEVSLDAPAELNPGQRGSVCGVRVAESQGEPMRIYLVEFGNGAAIEIAENRLSKVPV